MILNKDGFRLLERSIQREQSLIRLDRSSSNLSKTEVTMVGLIEDRLKKESKRKKTFNLEFNSKAKSVIKKILETKLEILTEKVMPEYDSRKNNGSDVESYIEKSNILVKLMKEVIEQC